MLAQELQAAELTRLTCLTIIMAIIIIVSYGIGTHYHDSTQSVHFSDKY